MKIIITKNEGKFNVQLSGVSMGENHPALTELEMIRKVAELVEKLN